MAKPKGYHRPLLLLLWILVFGLLITACDMIAVWTLRR